MNELAVGVDGTIVVAVVDEDDVEVEVAPDVNVDQVFTGEVL